MTEGKAERLFFRLEAPFAACRSFVAGWHRPTAPFLTPSAVHGLLLNLAGFESRLWEHEQDHDGSAPASLTRSDLPQFSLALGLPPGAETPRITTIYQQLHNYPVGTSGMPPEWTKGTKNNITPVRREMLCGVRAVVAIECDDKFANRLRNGLRGKFVGRTYGLPFLGDNNFLLDRFHEIALPEARWLKRVGDDTPEAAVMRLTIKVDRAKMTRTISDLFALSENFSADVPAAAWST